MDRLFSAGGGLSTITAPRCGTGFVQALHRDALGRAATRAEVAAGLDALLQSSRSEYVESITLSDDALARLVNSYHTDLLGRPANDDERLAGIAALRCGQALDRIIATLLTSQEYVNATQARALRAAPLDAYVAALYVDLLRRLPTQAEISQAIDKLPPGDRRPFVLSLLRNVEYRARFMEQLYRRLLDREPTPDEMRTYVAPGNTGIDLQKARLNVLASDEYFNRWC